MAQTLCEKSFFNLLLYSALFLIFQIGDVFYPFDVLLITYFACVILLGNRASINMSQPAIIVALYLLFVLFSSLNFINNKTVLMAVYNKTFLVLTTLATLLLFADRSEKFFDKIMLVFIFSAFSQGILGIFGFAGQIDTLIWEGRAKGLLADPNLFGAFMGMGIVFCSHAVLHRSASRLLLVPMLGVLLIALFLSFSRACISSTALSIAFLLYFNRKYVRFSLLFLAITFFLALATPFILYNYERIQFLTEVRFHLNQDQDIGRYGRINLFWLALDVTLDHPMGIGVTNYFLFFPTQIHNIFISVLVNYGWLAGAFFFTFSVLTLVYPFHLYSRGLWDYRATAIALGLLVQYLVGMTQAIEWWRHFWFLLGFTWAYYAHLHVQAASIRLRTATT